VSNLTFALILLLIVCAGAVIGWLGAAGLHHAGLRSRGHLYHRDPGVCRWRRS
jgi:hypothetical protein